MSNKPPQSRKVSIAGPVGKLEAIVETPADGVAKGAVSFATRIAARWNNA